MRNEIKGIVHSAIATYGSVRLGLVSAVDPVNYAVKVKLQPTNAETTWLPVGTISAGTLRVCSLPPMNAHVVLAPIENDPEHLVVIGCIYDTQVMPPKSPATGIPPAPGEVYLQTGCDVPPSLGDNNTENTDSPSFKTPWMHMTKDAIHFGVGGTHLRMDASGIYVTGSVMDVQGVLRTSTGYTGTVAGGQGELVDVSAGIVTGKGD